MRLAKQSIWVVRLLSDSRDGPTSGGGTASASSSERRQLEGSPDTVVRFYERRTSSFFPGVPRCFLSTIFKYSYVY